MNTTSKVESPQTPIEGYQHKTNKGVACTEQNKLVVDGTEVEKEVHAYRRRWFVLFVFWMHMLVNNWIWISFASIADLVACYYDVSLFWVNTLSWVFMLVYLLGFTPAIWFLNRFGLKMTGVVAASANAVGAWLRFAGSGPEYFWFILAGSTVASFGNLLEWGAGSFLSGTWFPPNERAFATSAISSQGEQFGVLLGLVLGPLFIQSSNTETVCEPNETGSQAYLDWQMAIQSQLFYYLLAQALLASVLFFITFLIPSDPPIPPSKSNQMRDMKVSLLKSFASICRNHYFLLYIIVFGIFLAGAGSFVTVFDEILYAVYSASDQNDIFYLGIAMQFCSILGVIVISKWIDFTKAFYCATLTVCVGSTLAILAFSLLIQLHTNFYIVCIPVILTRALLVTFQGVGFEYGVEMTYPLPESFSSGVLNGASQFVSIILIVVPTLMLQNNLTVYCGWFFTALFLFGTFVMLFVHPKLKRLEVDLEELKLLCSCCWLRCYGKPSEKSIN